MKLENENQKNIFETIGRIFQKAGPVATRISLVTVIAWIGAMKFTAYEAAGISGFVSHSPLLNWIYQFLSKQGFSNALGVVEIAIAFGLLIGTRQNLIGVVAAALSVGMFTTTLSFMLTTPGTFEASLGFPALSVVPGQFLVKDLIALGACLGILGESLVVLANSKNLHQQSN